MPFLGMRFAFLLLSAGAGRGEGRGRMNVTPLRPEKRDPVFIQELAELGLQNTDANAEWIVQVYMLGGLLTELAKLCAVRFPHAAVGGALVTEIQRQTARLFDDLEDVPQELVCWPDELEVRRRYLEERSHE